MTERKIRYRLYAQNPETKKWKVSITGKHLKNVCEKMQKNLQFNPDWYTDDKGKRLKLRLVAEEVKGKKVEELEEYTITKGWKVKGYFTNWEGNV